MSKVEQSLSSCSIAVKKRFWAKVIVTDKFSCWFWTAAQHRSGYGAFKFMNETLKSHRISYIFSFGHVPDGMFICHKCDTPSCVNPNHLFLGTSADNMADMASKGRSIKGDRHPFRKHPELMSRGESHYLRKNPEKIMRGESKPNAKLNAGLVLKIREMSVDGLTRKEIASALGVGFYSVVNVLRGRLWTHVNSLQGQ